MKYAIITEQDQGYRASFSEYLQGLGLTLVSDGVLSFDGSSGMISTLDGLHGVRVSDAPVAEMPTAADDVYAWLKAYAGTFDFLLKMKAIVDRGKQLTFGQAEAVRKCMARDAEWKARREAKVVAPQVFSVKPGDVLEIKKGFAQVIRREHNLARTYFNLEVVAVHRETDRAIQVETVVSAKVTSHCCVCGRSLTDPASIASGIGPICADNNGIPWGEVEITKEAMATLFSREAQMKLWIPKSQIKNLDSLREAARAA